MVRQVQITGWGIVEPGQTVEIKADRGTIALDGEREIELLQGTRASVRINTDGPWVVDFDQALEAACA